MKHMLLLSDKQRLYYEPSGLKEEVISILRQTLSHVLDPEENSIPEWNNNCDVYTTINELIMWKTRS